MAKIFISYAREDRPKAQQFARVFEDRWSVWWDTRLKAGEVWDEVIERELTAAHCVVVLWSRVSVKKHWVRVEAHDGLQRGILIPALIENVRPPLAFRLIQAEFLIGWSGDRSDPGLVRLLAAVGDRLDSVEPEPEPERLPPSIADFAVFRDPESFEAVVAMVGAHRQALLQAKLMSAVHLVHFEPGRIEMRLAESAPDDLPRRLSRFLNENTSRRWLVTVSRSEGEATLVEQRAAVNGTHIFVDFAVFRDIDAPWYPEMVALPAGEFLMGSPESEEGGFDQEGPRHLVTIGTRFALGRYPVTFTEYDHFCDVTKRKKPKDQGWGRGRRPVINVSWQGAAAYCEWLAKETGKPYRLPSEAEWEYACRAGTTSPFSFGNMITERDANFDGNVGKTTEVGTFPPNPWGLYDMHGNVLEWVADHWHGSYDGAPADGRAWTDTTAGAGADRVFRGGSWSANARAVRSAYRNRPGPGYRYVYSGYRCARVLA